MRVNSLFAWSMFHSTINHPIRFIKTFYSNQIANQIDILVEHVIEKRYFDIYPSIWIARVIIEFPNMLSNGEIFNDIEWTDARLICCRKYCAVLRSRKEVKMYSSFSIIFSRTSFKMNMEFLFKRNNEYYFRIKSMYFVIQAQSIFFYLICIYLYRIFVPRIFTNNYIRFSATVYFSWGCFKKIIFKMFRNVSLKHFDRQTFLSKFEFWWLGLNFALQYISSISSSKYVFNWYQRFIIRPNCIN